MADGGKINVTESLGSPDRTTSTIDIEVDAPSGVKAKIKRDVGEYLLEQVRLSVAREESPVDGESWPALSKSYAKEKLEEVGNKDANMELTGRMLDSLTYRSTPTGVEIGFFDKQAWKADGHLKFSGEDNGIPKRRFLPEAGQEFTPDIMDGIEQIISDNIAEAAPITKSDLKGVTSTAELYDVLSEYFDGMSRAEIRTAVMRSVDLTEMLDEADLLDLL